MWFWGMFLSIGIIYGIGFFLETLILGRRKQRSFFETLGLGFALGTGALAFGSLILLMLNVRLGRTIYMLFFLPPALIGFLILIRRYARLPKNFSAIFVKFQGLGIWEWAFLLIILLSVMVIAANALIGPLTSWDARAIWGLKGKFIYYEKTIHSASFLDLDYVHYHPNHPLLMPLLESFFSAMIGNWNERAIKINFLLFYLSLILVFYCTLRQMYPRRFALMFTAILSLIRCYQKYAASGHADVPLSFYYTLGAIYLLTWMRQGGIRPLLASSLFMGFGLFTKNEGLALAGILAFVLIIFCLLSAKNMGKSRWLAVLVFSVLLGIMASSWFLTRHILPGYFDENYPSRVRLRIIYEGSRMVPDIILGLLVETVRFDEWGLFWPLVYLAIILVRKVKLERPEKYLALLLGLEISLYIFIYMLLPLPDWLRRGSQTRLLMHLVPLTLILVSSVYYRANAGPFFLRAAKLSLAKSPL